MTTYYCTTIEEALRRVKRAVKAFYPGSYFGGITLRSGRRGFAIYREGRIMVQYLVENPLETDLLIPHLIAPPFFFSSKNKMQADEMKNRSSLHSILVSYFRPRGSLSTGHRGSLSHRNKGVTLRRNFQLNRADHGRGTYTQMILVYAMIGTIDFNNLFDGMRIGVVVGILLVIYLFFGVAIVGGEMDEGTRRTKTGSIHGSL